MEYTYDDLYRLTAETRTGTGSYTRSYGYDLAGNLTTYGGSTFASYDNTNKISSLSGGSISYDTDGNTTAVSGAGIPSTTLTWDMRNKLLRQQTSTDDLSYRYDHTGKRVVRWATAVPAVKTFFVFSGDTLIGEVIAGLPSYAYTWGDSGLISQRAITSNQSLWYHFGPQGETRQLTNSLAVAVDTYSYDGYGRLISSSGIDPNPFRYGGLVGYYSDGQPGLMLATYRWYSPHLSRWVSHDPIEYEGGDNRVLYVGANPIAATDWNGLNPGTYQCFVSCSQQQLGWPTAVGAGAAASAYASIPKPRVGFGGSAASTQTSIASWLGRKILPKSTCSLPYKMWAPTWKNLRSSTNSIPGYTFRWAGWLGGGLLANDAAQIALCTWGCENLE